MTRITVVRGDITAQDVDAIVNAANSSLYGGGGVDGAIHRAGGPAILEECRDIRRRPPYQAGLPTGHAVAASAGRLPARFVIHTVGPVYRGSPDPAAELASCYTEVLRVADELGAKTVAFPAISTGVYGYPIAEAAPVSIAAVRRAGTAVEEVRFVLFSDEAHAAYAAAAAEPDTS
jgi:O-acetyl-ADP-ribose deacetylase (regulator of RNase III)